MDSRRRIGDNHHQAVLRVVDAGDGARLRYCGASSFVASVVAVPAADRQISNWTVRSQRISAAVHTPAKATTTTAFAEVIVSPTVAPSGAFEVLLRSGQVVRVPAVFDAAALRRLVDALEEVA